MVYDVIVIGAGPAGSTAARRLAQQGRRVLLLERAKLPRYKPCGGGLTRKAIEMLDFDISSTIEAEASNFLLSYDSGPITVQKYKSTAVWCVMRDRFDYLLAQKAVEAGARLEEGVKVESVTQDAEGVTIATKNNSYHARFLVGADGSTGITARSVGLMTRRHDGAALEAEIQVSSQALEKWHDALLFDFGSIPWGYAWIFPKNEHLSIGVGTWRASSKLKLHEYLDRFVAKQPDLKGSMITKGHLLPLGGRADRFDSGRVVLAGDAAATADPLTGEGISHAIHSAIIAAEEIGVAITRGDANLSSYTRRINKAINADFRYARVATNVFYRWPRHSYHAFIEDGGLLEPTTGIMEGTMSYRRLIADTLRYSPRLLWRTVKKKLVHA